MDNRLSIYLVLSSYIVEAQKGKWLNVFDLQVCKNRHQHTSCKPQSKHTYIQDQFANFNTASSSRIILKTFGKTVEGFELLIILLVLHLKEQ